MELKQVSFRSQILFAHGAPLRLLDPNFNADSQGFQILHHLFYSEQELCERSLTRSHHSISSFIRISQTHLDIHHYILIWNIQAGCKALYHHTYHSLTSDQNVITNNGRY